MTKKRGQPVANIESRRRTIAIIVAALVCAAVLIACVVSVIAAVR